MAVGVKDGVCEGDGVLVAVIVEESVASALVDIQADSGFVRLAG